MPHARTGETPYTQHRHFGPAIANTPLKTIDLAYDDKAEWDTPATLWPPTRLFLSRIDLQRFRPYLGA